MNARLANDTIRGMKHQGNYTPIATEHGKF
jgi:hypothetical protein